MLFSLSIFCSINYVFRLGLRILSIDPSTDFSTFDWDQLAKIRQYRWKERVLSFRVIC